MSHTLLAMAHVTRFFDITGLVNQPVYKLTLSIEALA